jgi:transposase-like protein
MSHPTLPLVTDQYPLCPLCGSTSEPIGRVNSRVVYKCTHCSQEFELLAPRPRPEGGRA